MHCGGGRLRLLPTLTHHKKYVHGNMMTTYNHPNATTVIVSTRLKWPNPGIPHRVLVVEANIPLSDK
jgi:hypothetical protein